ncbi:unnamed protein product, partial [Symbiodinium sp. CCMP2456]
WSWGYEWPRSWDNNDWSSGYESSRGSTTSSSTSTELLPQFIQGWYLLADANLDAGERNIVMTALGGNFEPQRVAQELRNQFSESDVKKRDSQRRYQSYIGEYLENDEDDTEIYETGNHDYGAEGLSDEGHALVVDAEEAAQEAMSAMINARRTLREARQRQHAVKQNRKYYQGNGTSGRGSSSSTTAPFVCYADVHAGFATDHDEHYAMTTVTEDDGLTTAEAVRQGMAVIDGGATQTIGSVAAVEAVMRQNRAKYGHSGLRGVDYKVTMDKMTCPQMVLSLRAYGEEPPKGWKKVQFATWMKMEKEKKK